MKILIVTGAFYPAIGAGGPPETIRSLARVLLSRGHRVTLYTSNLLSASEKLGDSTEERDFDGIQVVYFNSVFRYNWSAIYPGVVRYARRELAQYDVVHGFGYRDFGVMVVAELARRRNIPYVISPMGSFLPIFRSLLKKRVFDSLIGRRLLSNASAVVGDSELEARELVEGGLPRDKVVMNPNGIDLAPFEQLPGRAAFRTRFGVADESLVCLYLGRLSRKKGIDLLLRAFADVEEPRAYLVIAGPDAPEGSYRSELRRLACDLGLDGRVLFTGTLSAKEKVEAFASADIFVLASPYENFGNAVAEAIAASVPVVITDRCGIAPSVRGRVGLVIPFDQRALTAAMDKLLGDNGLRRDFADACADVRNEFSWDRPVAQLEAMYERLAVAGT